MTWRGAPLISVGFAEVAEFHVEAARVRSPELALRPLLVGGDPAKRGKVVAASAELRKRGIVDGMGVAEALMKAPDAHYVRTDLEHARALSGLLRAAVRQVVEAVEPDGLAGFYFRAPSECAAAIELAHRLIDRVEERTGLPLRFGAAPARFVARIAAHKVGRSGAMVVGFDNFEDYLQAQPIECLPGVGPKTAARLAELGATDIPTLRELGLERLEVLLGNHGRSLWLLACGDDPVPLRAKRHPATLSREETLPEVSSLSSEQDRAQLFEILARLAGRLESALRRDGLSARRIALKLTDETQRTVTRSLSLNDPIADATQLILVAQDLYLRAAINAGRVRRVGLILKGLEISGAEDRQLDLF